MKKMTKAEKSEAIAGYIFASPFIIGLLVFALFPFLSSLYFSFTNYDLINKPKFIGLTNYKILFTSDSIFFTALGNTLYHVLIATPVGIFVGVGLALLLNNKVKGISIYRVLYYLPNVVSIVAMALLWLWLFNPSFGLINQMLAPLYDFFHAGPIKWLLDPNLSKLTLILMGIWTAGGSMIIYLAQLQDIPVDLYEAADMDGASSATQLFKITLPLMTPSIFYNLIMGIIGNFQMFTLAYIMTGGGPERSTYYYAYYLYDKAFADRQMGMASAMAWVLLLITLLITFFVFLFSKKWVFYLGGSEN